MKPSNKLIALIVLILTCLFCVLFVSCSDDANNQQETTAVADNQSDEEKNGDAETVTEAEEATRSREEIEAEQSDTRITDIEYWEKLGYDKDSMYYQYIKAFLECDTDTLEQLTWVTAGTYNEYSTIKLDKNYSVTIEGEYNDIYFNFIIRESGVEHLPVGEYSMHISDGPLGLTMLAKDYYEKAEQNGSDSAAYEAVNRWLRLGYRYLLPDYNELSDEEKEWYNRTAAEYIFFAFADEVGENSWTPEILQSYVKKYFDIDDFPMDCYPMNGGVYDLSYTAHGTHHWCSRYVGETVVDDMTTVTVQFFADGSETIKSHTVEYKLQYVDGGYKFITSTVVYETLHEPKNMQM